MMRAVLIAATLALGACAHQTEQIEQTQLDHPSGWSAEVRAEAQTAWPLAQLAANVYGSDTVDLGSAWVVKRHVLKDRIGFGHMIVEHRLPDGQVETIIVFRGTDFLTWQDWVFGNIGRSQNEAGIKLVDEVRQTWPDRDGPIIVAGHSLGGAIAIHTSLHRKNVTAWAFNTSPRFWRERHWFRRLPAQTNDRYSIVERGELLTALRAFGRNADQRYTSIGCRRGIGPLRDHSIRPLANCLTAIAAWNDAEDWREAEVRETISRNAIPWPDQLPRPDDL